MGRHSAPDTDDDDHVGAVAVAAPAGPVGRRGRHGRDDDGEPELPTEQTTLIPSVEASLAAGVDAAGGDLTGVRAAELEPILPGEAVVPPPAGDLDVLDGLLESPPARRWGRRPKPVRDAPAPEPVVEPAPEPVVEPAPEPAVDPDPEPVAEPQPTAEPAAAPLARDQHGTQADLALLRSDAALRARCLAAVLVPFAAYAVVMLVVGGHGVQWLYWIWIPTITAGVLFGVFLDRAHRTREARRTVGVSGS